MISFSYKNANASFAGFLQSFAASLQAPVVNGLLQLPPQAGTGFIRHIELPNGLSVLLINFTLADALYFKRLQGEGEYYIFTCESFTVNKGFQYRVDDVGVEETRPRVSAMYLVDFISDLEVYAPAGTSLRSLRIIMNREWLARYFGLDNSNDVLLRYLALKTKTVQVKEADFESARLKKEMLLAAASGEKPPLFYESRLLMIMENFFTWLYAQKSTRAFDAKISRDDVERVMAVEKELVKDLAFAPYIDDLAKQAGMSSARLKKLFKDIFGLPVYQYFQKNRMQKARELLLGQGLSVTDAGLEMGYENISNFATAFKKQFGILPGDLAGRRGA